MKKNKRMIILVFVLLLSVGIALAYFVGKTLFQGNGAKTKVTTASINGATITVEGELEFNAEGMLPGHKEMSRIKVTAVGDNVLLPFNLIWTGTNGLNTPLNFKVYKTTKSVEVTSKCEDKKEKVAEGQKVYEECEIENIDKLGNVVSTGTIAGNKTEESVIIAEDEFINATTDPGTDMYYYIEVEYPNLDEIQNPDMGGEFRGNINAEASDAEPDINILAVYTEQGDGSYKETKEIPKKEENLVLNTTKSTCNNEAKPKWNNKDWNLTIDNLTKSGTSCYLYFGKQSSQTLASLGLSGYVKGEVEKFTGPSCGSCDVQENGIYKTEDNDGTSYYFRGTVSDNWVKFGENDDQTKDVWWRIVRINGDGTIRLIYSGMFEKGKKPNNAMHETGENTIVSSNQTYTMDGAYNDNTYVGFYTGSTGGNSFDNTHSNTTPSNVATQLKNWYEGSNWNEKYNQYIDENAGFCNDRTINPNYGTWYTDEGTSNRGTGTVVTAYGPFSRFLTNTNSWNSTEQKPTLICGKDPSKEGNEVDQNAYQRDLFTPQNASKGNGKLDVPVGLITADEVAFAGGYGGQPNDGYYLYNKQYFWTMSPYFFSGRANEFYVSNGGHLSYTSVDWTPPGVRPVINLRADVPVKFQSEDLANKGTIDNPYIIE